MTDIYLDALKELERRSKDNILSFSTVLTQRLDELAATMVDKKMSDNDFIKLNELYYARYYQEEDKAGMMFCVLRVQQFLAMKKTGRNHKAYPKIFFTKRKDPDTVEFLKGKPNYYKKMLDNFKKKAIVVSLIVAIFLMICLVLILHLHFLFGWILSILIAAIIYVIALLYIYDKTFDIQMNDMAKKISDVQYEVDHSIQEA